MPPDAPLQRLDTVYASYKKHTYSQHGGLAGSDWHAVGAYDALLRCDRRAFAWEWLRRNQVYRSLWAAREILPAEAAKCVGLLALVDPVLTFPEARPIWSTRMDPKVLKGRLATRRGAATDLFDIRAFAPFVSVEVDMDGTEHWLFSDGHWAIRLDVQGGTLFGGPALIEYQLNGVESAKSKLDVLRQFLALSENGRLPKSMVPRERRAPRWILELRVGDAILTGATEQEIARELFRDAIAPTHWRQENMSHRLRVQRLVRTARHRLDHPLSGPWFK